MSLALEARDLRVHHEELPPLHGVNLQLTMGKAMAIGGIRDSGQTTLMRICSGLVPHGEGDLYVLGLSYQTNPRKIKEQIGIFSVESHLDRDISVVEALIFHGMSFGISLREAKLKSREALRQVQMETHEQAVISNLNVDECTMFRLARAIMTRPKILFLEHLSRGVSTVCRNMIKQVVQQHVHEGGAALMFMDRPSDLPAEIDQLVLLSKGKVVASGTPQALMMEHASPEVVEFNLAPVEREYYLNKIRERYRYQIYQNQVRMYLKPQQDYKDVLRLIASDRILVRKPSLDDVYLNVAGETFGEASS